MRKLPIKLLIDADVYAYKAASAVEKNITFDGDNFIRCTSLSEAQGVFEETLLHLREKFGNAGYILAFTDGENFRKTLLPSYKAHRKVSDRPVVLEALKEQLMEEHPFYVRDGLEADDVLGILSTSTKIFPDHRRIIVSVDKDMKSIPGEFYDSKEDRLHTITKEAAEYWHCMQTLMGDSTDGYSGCPGIGPVKAEKILEEEVHGGYEKLWPLVVETFEKAKLTEEDALLQARMARILQVNNYDFKKKEVKLWEPPKTTKPPK